MTDTVPEAITQARMAEMLALAPLQPAEPPKDRVFYARQHVPMKWTPYKPTSQEVKRGKKGRWQQRRAYGLGWENADEDPQAGAWIEDVINHPDLRLASQDAGEGLREAALALLASYDDGAPITGFGECIERLRTLATPPSDAGSTTRSGGEGVRDNDRALVADILDEVSSLLQHDGIGAVADLIRNGEYDDHEAVMIAVRHRLATAPSPDAPPDLAARLRYILDDPMLTREMQVEHILHAIGSPDASPDSGEAVARLIEWAREEQALPAGCGAGWGHIDENNRFKLRDMITAIDSAQSSDGFSSIGGRSLIIDRLTRCIEAQRTIIDGPQYGTVETEAARLSYAAMLDARRVLARPSPSPAIVKEAGEVERLRAALRLCADFIRMFRDNGASQLGEGVHTGLRKGSDASDSGKLWSVIAHSRTTAWSDAVAWAHDPFFSMWGGNEALAAADAALSASNAAQESGQ